MKKKCYSLVLGAVLLASLPLTAHAETSHGGPWRVAFTEEAKMESAFSSSEMADVISGMQPGDETVAELELYNQNSAATDWYMTNQILSSLEDSAEGASGGAYTYRLTYTGPDGTQTVLFSSDTVGGDGSEAGEGLHSVSDALEDYFYLGTLASGQKGTVELTVALDGETQGNSYQGTLADLTMNFAVEMNNGGQGGNPGGGPGGEPGGNQGSGGSSTRVVKTGDESRLGLFLGLAGASGVLFLGLAFFGLVQRKKQESEVRQDVC